MGNKNYLQFTKMEWWRSKNSPNVGDAYVGFCEDGSIHLTFDVRSSLPVFSPLCKVGSKEGHKQDAYEHYRTLFSTLEGYSIRDIKSCEYTSLYDKKIYKFAVCGNG